MSMISDNSPIGNRFRCKKCGCEYETDDKGHSLKPERRICRECRSDNNCEKGSLGELLTDYIQPHARKNVDEHPCWSELVDLVGSDGERDGKVIYDRVVNQAVHYPDLAHLPFDELGTPSKRDLVLTLDIEKVVIPFIRRYKDRWSERDIEKVAKKVRRPGLGQSAKFTNLVQESYDAAEGNPIKSIDITKPSICSGFLLPDLFKVDSVADKAVVLAAVYAYYFDTQQWKPSSDEGENAGYQIGPAKQSVEAILLKFADDDEVVDKTHVENFRHDVRLVPLIGKEEAGNVLRWVDEVSAVCNPVAPAPPAPTGISDKKSKPKRAETKEKLKTDEVIFLALVEFHKYEGKLGPKLRPTAGNHSPATLNDLAERSGCSKATISRYLERQFGGYKAYCGVCDTEEIAQALMIREGMPPKAVLRERPLKREPETYDPEPND